LNNENFNLNINIEIKMMKKIAFITNKLNNTDTIVKLYKWAEIHVYTNDKKGAENNVKYFSLSDWYPNYDYTIVVDDLSIFLDYYMKKDVYLWITGKVNNMWNGHALGNALLKNIDIKDIKYGNVDWKNLLELNFEMKYKDVSEISQSKNSSYFLHPSQLLGDTKI